MIQVWLIDKDNFFTGESKFVEEVTDCMTTEPYTVGYIKGKLENGKWVEGATEEEILEWEEANKIDICPVEVKTNQQLTEENKQLWDTVEFLLKQTNMIPMESTE